VPDDAMITKRSGKIIGEFKDLVFPDGYEAGKGKKRVSEHYISITLASSI
jgi:hypothetical protein